MYSLFNMTDNFKANPDNSPNAKAIGNTIGTAFGGGQVGDMLGGIVGNATNGVMKFLTDPVHAFQDIGKGFQNNNQPSNPMPTQAISQQPNPIAPRFNWSNYAQQQPNYQEMFSRQGLSGMSSLPQEVQGFLGNRIKPVNYNPFKVNPWNG